MACVPMRAETLSSWTSIRARALFGGSGYQRTVLSCVAPTPPGITLFAHFFALHLEWSQVVTLYGTNVLLGPLPLVSARAMGKWEEGVGEGMRAGDWVGGYTGLISRWINYVENKNANINVLF